MEIGRPITLMRVKISDAVIEQLKTSQHTEPEIIEATQSVKESIEDETDEEIYYVGEYFIVTSEALYIVVFDDEIITNDEVDPN